MRLPAAPARRARRGEDMRTRFCQTLGIAILAFGIGVLVSFFLPEQVLVVIEAITIIGIGIIYFSKK